MCSNVPSDSHCCHYYHDTLYLNEINATNLKNGGSKISCVSFQTSDELQWLDIAERVPGQ